jgi:hypothetical protein
MVDNMDAAIRRALEGLIEDRHVVDWHAKEHDWVNYFVFRHLLQQCTSVGPLSDPAQIGIEVSVPQPPGYTRPVVCRDIVVWEKPGMSCWEPGWIPTRHPLAIVEWKTHRPGRRNRDVPKEREWLRAYSQWQPTVTCYAVSVEVDRRWPILTCTRFFRNRETRWIHRRFGTVQRQEALDCGDQQDGRHA